MLIARQLHVKCTQNARNCVIKCCKWACVLSFIVRGFIFFFEFSTKSFGTIDVCAILRIRQRHLNIVWRQFSLFALSMWKWLSMCAKTKAGQKCVCTHTLTSWLSPLSAVKCSRCAPVFASVCLCMWVCVSRILMHAAPRHRFQLFSDFTAIFSYCEGVCVCVFKLSFKCSCCVKNIADNDIGCARHKKCMLIASKSLCPHIFKMIRF